MLSIFNLWSNISVNATTKYVMLQQNPISVLNPKLLLFMDNDFLLKFQRMGYMMRAIDYFLAREHFSRAR